MVSNCCLGDRAYVALTCLKHVWVVGRKNSGSSAYNRMVWWEDIIGGSNHGARHVDKLLLLLITKSDGKSCGSRRSEEGYQQSIWTC